MPQLGMCLIGWVLAAQPTAVEAVPWFEPVGQVPIRVEAPVAFGEDTVTVQADPQPLAATGPVPAVVYVAMDGVMLSHECPDGSYSHSAHACYGWLLEDTFLPAVGSASLEAAYLQRVRAIFSDHDVVVTDTLPPRYVPYTLAVVSGGASLKGDGNCGFAPLTCGGQKRNAVSFSFAGNPDCPDIGATIAHEAGHALGLEHVGGVEDLMAPGQLDRDLVDACFALLPAEPDAIATCPFSHGSHCAGYEQQNSYAELMSYVGPRSFDTTPPEIVDIQPADGSVFTVEDSFLVTASVSEDSGFVAAEWTWLEGVPAELGEGFSKCTNGMCDLEFTANEIESGAWDFASINKAPAGEHSFVFKVEDAYGNFSWELIHVTIVEEATGTSGGEGAEHEASTGEDEEPDEATTDTGTSDDADTFDSDDEGPALPPYAIGDAPQGCGCTNTGDTAPGPGAWLVVFVALGIRRVQQHRCG